MMRAAPWVAIAIASLAGRPVGAQGTPERPPGVTDSAIARGRGLYHGSAGCSACHGAQGGGTDEGPALTGGLWLHGPGTYEWLVEQIEAGIPAHRTMTGKPMPMRGWVPMSDEQVRAVAAYVWWLTHPPRSEKPDARRG